MTWMQKFGWRIKEDYLIIFHILFFFVVVSLNTRLKAWLFGQMYFFFLFDFFLA